MRFSKVADFLLDLLYVPKCAGCGEPVEPGLGAEGALCLTCRTKWEKEKRTVCAVCGGVPKSCTCMPPFLRDVPNLYRSALVPYHRRGGKALVNTVIFDLKRRHHGALEQFLGKELSYLLRTHLARHGLARSQCVLTYPARSSRAMREYGYDHMEYVTRYLAKETGISFLKCFRRRGGREQKDLDGEERMRNVQKSLLLQNNVNVLGKTVVLVDDVLTTGATMRVAAEELFSAGAENVVILTISATVKETPLQTE